MKLTLWLQALLASFLPSTLALPSSTINHRAAAWPDTPFTVSGRDILSASGTKIRFAGVNWPGAADTMLPEGLQYNSIANIVSFIKSLNMNVVRLTYAIEMIDDIFSNSPNQSLQNTLINALGDTNGRKVLAQVLKNNPGFTKDTTRLQVFDAVAAELAKQKIWVHLDNHVSKAEWCCGSDGNGWFGDQYFDVAKWERGLGYMANHAKSWSGFTSISLRNELRQPSSSTARPYNWNSWIENVIPAANGIHSNNSAPLIFFSGQGYDTDDTYFIQRQTWNSETFKPESYAFKNKIVYEIHNYQNSATNCNQIQPGLYNNAYCAMNTADTSCPNHGPVVMSEFGFDQTDGSSGGAYAQCIKSVVTNQPGGPAGWMMWTLSGSYYIRSGTQDYEDSWGLLNKNWSGWRNSTVVDNYVKPFVQATLG
ncbi:hypothetical protein CB0940_11967 [Cercospora beticola]|uniref:Uncharacterized protein n=1 Tax=Cercospora beticola TaxID=122368 RepID=A0A2G5ID90_CERBT|nr:hypothetical protein CB0940_11967 [Cercospora beticola]PIB02826.1 hypothetical protein CB0940_11967 [Cercospora beticola]WPB04340.1 hypothetical protein RHO25_008986 [Cercospora beticola]